MNPAVEGVLILLIIAAAPIAAYFGYRYGQTRTRASYEQSLREAAEQGESRVLALQEEHRAALREARDEAKSLRDTTESEARERRNELQRQEQRLTQKEEAFDRRSEQTERREKALGQRESQLGQREAQLSAKQAELDKLVVARQQALEQVSQMSMEQARAEVLRHAEETSRQDAARIARAIEAETRERAEEKARGIITLAIQRCASDQVSDVTITAVPIPNEEMKGRVIGREGRNIRTLEGATGVDVIIDDTPDAVTLSSFDPVRREVARIALQKLILDGRIQPARIEEMVGRARGEVDRVVEEEGQRAVNEANINNFPPDLIRLIGRLHFRSSYGQNVLNHSIEVSVLAAAMAAELGANVSVCKQAGLLHDLGKAIDQEVEGPHHLISGEIARRYGRSSEVIHAIVAHHATEAEPQSLEAAIVQAADAISSARPGARRETVDLYIKRLENLETIATSFQGVERAFAVQAGRELRIIVRPDEIDEMTAVQLARDIAHKIEETMDYPGQIKVAVVRETRAVEYAR